MTKKDRIIQTAQMQPAIFSLGLVAIQTTALYLVFEPRWETNDDVAMSMVAHGYGLTVQGSPHLIFSNVLWGYVVRAIPSIGGVSGYAVATIVSLGIVGWSILHCLHRLGVAYGIALLAVVLILLRPLQFPQFTITAGLLVVAAVVVLQAYDHLRSTTLLLTGCALLLASFLVRQLEFILVLFVGIPLLPWQALLQRREAQFALPALGLALTIAFAMDAWSYSGQEWSTFSELNGIRGQFTDFGAGPRLLQQPEILARHGYSQNDISLVEHWFFVDPNIASPVALTSMFTELGRPAPLALESVRSGMLAIEALAAPELLPLLLVALALLIVAPHWRVAIAWALCLAAVFTIGALGKPGAVRVYVPLVALLIVASLMFGLRDSITQRRVVAGTLLIGCLFNLYRLIPEASASAQKIQQVQVDMAQLPQGPIVIWGASFPFEYAFPPLREIKSDAPKIYGLDVFTLAPFSVGSSEYAAGRGLVERLQSSDGLPIIVLQNNVEMLRKYCLERLGKRLTETSTRETPSFTIRQLRCGEM
ncbi:MAG: hypothetical protein K2Y71_29115 [Xanthobacteraceae bacterium]|nr:hypothetical protein [Xanthobacteraceae bacterium]